MQTQIPEDSCHVFVPFFPSILLPGRILARLIQRWPMGRMWPIELVRIAHHLLLGHHLLPGRSYREQLLSSATIAPSFLLPSASRWSNTRTGCGISTVGRTPNPTGCSPGQPTVLDSALSRTTQFPGVPFYLSHLCEQQQCSSLCRRRRTRASGSEEEFVSVAAARKWVKALQETPNLDLGSASTEDRMVQNYYAQFS